MALWVMEGVESWEKGTAGAKALRPEHAGHPQRTAQRSGADA